ncbi:MAG: HNH endonuclease [Nitrospiria bacterium]
MNRKKGRSKGMQPGRSFSELDEEAVKREKAAARALRNSQWWKRQKSRGVCHYCHQQFRPSALTMDHIVPIIRGGRSTKGNVAPSCKECNRKKKDLLVMEWQEYRLGE